MEREMCCHDDRQEKGLWVERSIAGLVGDIGEDRTAVIRKVRICQPVKLNKKLIDSFKNQKTSLRIHAKKHLRDLRFSLGRFTKNLTQKSLVTYSGAS